MVTCKWLGHVVGGHYRRPLHRVWGLVKVDEGPSLPNPQAHTTPVGSCCLPALLQSTRKELFWPTKAFESPAPLEVTLLASEDDLGMAL
jgi:hypothetical protein